MSARLALAALALAAVGPAARAGEGPGVATAWRFTAEALATAGTSVLHGVGESAWGLRLGAGGVDGGGRAVLVTAAWSRGSSDGGVIVVEQRLGVGARLHRGRLGLGLDAELVRVEVERVSIDAPLSGNGVGARVLGSVDVFRLGARSAVIATLELGLVELGLGKNPSFEPSISAGLGLRL